MSITLSNQQDAAVKNFRAWFGDAKDRQYDTAPYYLQAGFAGTGKTTVLPFFIEACGLDPIHDVVFVAPTGKAAKIMTKKLKDQGFTQPAITIHKAIYRPKGLAFFALEDKVKATIQMLENAHSQAERFELQKTLKLLQIDLERAYLQNAPAFQLNADAEAIRKARLVVCDEASMVGEKMRDDMLYFGTPVLAIGDPGQLQPVGDKPGFFARSPDNILTEIHRQALDNPIIRLSMDIREGNTISYGKSDCGRLSVVSPKNDNVTCDMSRDLQIIVGTNGKRHRLTRKLRELSGLHACGPSVGELMIVTKNSRKHPSLVNGTQLMVTHDTGELPEGGITCRLRAKDEDGWDYDLNVIQGILEENYLGVNNWTASPRSVRHAMEADQNHQVDWAYAITCHKAQGSQWNDVCVHDESNMFRDQSQQWLYTAVTRAAETLTLVTDHAA